MEHGKSIRWAHRLRFVFLTLSVPFVAGIQVGAQATYQPQIPQVGGMPDPQAYAQQIRKREQDQLENLKRGVVTVQTKGADGISDEGTGFVVSFTPTSVEIVTALHVVRDATSIEVAFYENPGKFLRARKLPKDSSDLDVAMIEVVASQAIALPTDLPKYNFAASDTMQASSQVTSVDGDGVMVLNLITRLSHEGDQGRFEYTNTSVGKGFSGGPIFDMYQDVVGMHDAMRGDGRFAIGVKIEAALQALEKLGYTVPKAGPMVNPYTAEFFGRPARSAHTGLCASGCTTTFGAMKHVQHYSVYDTRGGFGAPICYTEEVYPVPADWPGAGMFFHVSSSPGCPLSKGAISIRWAQTDRKGDVDSSMSAVSLYGSSGDGFLRDAQGTMWKVAVQNPNFGEQLNLNAISITIRPFSAY